MSQASLKPPAIDFDAPALKRRRKRRALTDRLAGLSIGAGGVSVIVAVSLIFFYLLYEVLPLFRAAELTPRAEYSLPAPGAGNTLYGWMEEQGEIAMRLGDAGRVVFYRTATGAVMDEVALPLPEGVRVTAVGEAGVDKHLLALGLSDGSYLLMKHEYKVTYPEGTTRLITPQVTFPYGEAPVRLDEAGRAINQIAVRDNDSSLMVVAVADNHELLGRAYDKEESFLTGEVELTESELVLPQVRGRVAQILLGPETRWLYVFDPQGEVSMFDLQDRESPRLNQQLKVVSAGAELTSARFLLGGFSLLAGDSLGVVTQLFPVRDDSNRYRLETIRRFQLDGPVKGLAPEHQRKGFAAISSTGHLGLYYTTSERRVWMDRIADQPLRNVIMAPRANYLLTEDGTGTVRFYEVHNEHPDVSWSALWSKVWYEGYAEPAYIWQSSASNNDFEPKFSLSPLAFGTLKAAFYAMLLAMPLAICGAIYTANFMAPRLRTKIKPAIELMEALPTVILGFLAGLFFAPYMEAHLPGVFTVLILVPLAIVVFGFVWANLPAAIRHRVPEGWAPVLLIPVILIVGWFSFAISPAVELWLFGGNMPHWLTTELGIDFDQRNALVVGAAMGFAVIPTIFSITEDAIFSVPKSLIHGSLALGATPWQTLVRVVLPTASPGIFSAIMIGLGRAVGETMIVLMATGNTPVMDWNIFEGMRTLAANIAVEMPESEVASTHFRVLFLAALVLFLFTFVVNTLAEFIRQRLRDKYSVM
ncbi:ABC transporter permease subunit [Hahella sp. SMD15-11]|uniref:ABC transporter permease subunit n=1 Tax=Thermohahella caldifontis TaxID=3142973 RepID=A0AB39UT07_9GAMM